MVIGASGYLLGKVPIKRLIPIKIGPGVVKCGPRGAVRTRNWYILTQWHYPQLRAT